VVVSLPLGSLGGATTSLVSRMFLTRLTAAIASQGRHPEADRRETAVFLDEAHFMVGPALSGLFAQARKYNCSITVATQTPSQLEPHLDEVLTNAQNHLIGRLSRREAALVGDRIGERGVRALTTLPRHHLLLALEDNDPDLAPIILTPTPPPDLSPTSGDDLPTVDLVDGGRDLPSTASTTKSLIDLQAYLVDLFEVTRGH